MNHAFLSGWSRALSARLWRVPLQHMGGWRRAVMHGLRIGHMVVRELSVGGLNLRAASLVFTTLLALVPLLAVSFSVLKGFGVHNRMEDLLFNLLTPLGDQGQEFAGQIIAVVDKVEVGVLGGLGLVILLFAVLSLVQKVEGSLNHTWRVHKTRGFVQRFSGYLSVLLVGPLLVVAALGTEIVQRIAAARPFGADPALLPKLVPYLLVVGAFTFVYQFMPNTRVRFRSAVLGALVAGVLWALAGWGFASFVVNSPSSSYTAIYSSFAIVFFFILWLYLAWLILLVGGTVAFYHQHPEYLGVMPGDLSASNRLRERIALATLVRVGRAHLAGEAAPTAEDLSQAMELPAMLLDDVLDALIRAGFVVETAASDAGLVPARDVGHVRLVDVLAEIRTAHGHQALVPEHLPSEPEAEALMDELEGGAAALLGERTLESLIVQERTSATPLDLRGVQAASTTQRRPGSP